MCFIFKFTFFSFYFFLCPPALLTLHHNVFIRAPVFGGACAYTYVRPQLSAPKLPARMDLRRAPRSMCFFIQWLRGASPIPSVSFCCYSLPPHLHHPVPVVVLANKGEAWLCASFLLTCTNSGSVYPQPISVCGPYVLAHSALSYVGLPPLAPSPSWVISISHLSIWEASPSCDGLP